MASVRMEAVTRLHGGRHRGGLDVTLHEDGGGAVYVEVGGHWRVIGAIMFESVCLRDRSTGILLPVSSDCRAASISDQLLCLRIYRCKRLSATSRTGDDLLF